MSRLSQKRAESVAIVVNFLQSAVSVIAPVLLAVFIAIVASPPLRWLRRKRVPKWLALALIVFVLLEAISIWHWASPVNFKVSGTVCPVIRSG